MVPIGADEAHAPRLALQHPAGSAVTVEAVEVVFRGRPGCPLGEPRHVAGSEDAFALALDSDGALAWCSETDDGLRGARVQLAPDGDEPPEDLGSYSFYSVAFGVGRRGERWRPRLPLGRRRQRRPAGLRDPSRRRRPGRGGPLGIADGQGDGLPRLVPLPDGTWRAFWRHNGPPLPALDGAAGQRRRGRRELSSR